MKPFPLDLVMLLLHSAFSIFREQGLCVEEPHALCTHNLGCTNSPAWDLVLTS